MIYEGLMFFQENDLLEVKLNQHWNFVDKFIIIEAGETHTGLKKPFNFDHARFSKYSDKIVYRRFDSFNEEISKFPELSSRGISAFIKVQNQLVHDDWMRDNFQVEYVTKVIIESGAKDDDLLLFTCLDEILNEKAFEKSKQMFSEPNFKELYSNALGLVIPSRETNPPLVLAYELDLFAYKFNLFSQKTTVACMIKASTLKEFRQSELRYFACFTHLLKDAGWHFTFLDNTDGDKALNKYKSWAHSRDFSINRNTYFSLGTKEEAVSMLFKDYNLRKVSADNLPSWLIKNKELYADCFYE